MLTHERGETRTIHSATPLSCGGITRIRFKGYNLSRLSFLLKAADTPKVRSGTYHTEAPFSRKRGGYPLLRISNPNRALAARRPGIGETSELNSPFRINHGRYRDCTQRPDSFADNDIAGGGLPSARPNRMD